MYTRIEEPKPLTERFCLDLYSNGLFDQSGEYLCLGMHCTKYNQCLLADENAHHELLKFSMPPMVFEKREPVKVERQNGVQPAAEILPVPFLKTDKVVEEKPPRTGKSSNQFISKWQIPFKNSGDTRQDYWQARKICIKWNLPYAQALEKEKESAPVSTP